MDGPDVSPRPVAPISTRHLAEFCSSSLHPPGRVDSARPRTFDVSGVGLQRLGREHDEERVTLRGRSGERKGPRCSRGHIIVTTTQETELIGRRYSTNIRYPTTLAQTFTQRPSQKEDATEEFRDLPDSAMSICRRRCRGSGEARHCVCSSDSSSWSVSGRTASGLCPFCRLEESRRLNSALSILGVSGRGCSWTAAIIQSLCRVCCCVLRCMLPPDSVYSHALQSY